jgi:sugar phosphate isomerase/epimerase
VDQASSGHYPGSILQLLQTGAMDHENGPPLGELRRRLARTGQTHYLVHTTVADYVCRPRFRFQPNLVNYVREADVVRAVPLGEGFIDYGAFFTALKEIGFDGYVAYEMCSSLRGGGSEENLDRYARGFLDYMARF